MCGRFFYHLLPLGQPLLRPFKTGPKWKFASLKWTQENPSKCPWNVRDKEKIAWRVHRVHNVYLLRWVGASESLRNAQRRLSASEWLICLRFFRLLSPCFVCMRRTMLCVYMCAQYKTWHSTAFWQCACVWDINNPSCNQRMSQWYPRVVHIANCVWHACMHMYECDIYTFNSMRCDAMCIWIFLPCVLLPHAHTTHFHFSFSQEANQKGTRAIDCHFERFEISLICTLVRGNRTRSFKGYEVGEVEIYLTVNKSVSLEYKHGQTTFKGQLKNSTFFCQQLP